MTCKKQRIMGFQEIQQIMIYFCIFITGLIAGRLSMAIQYAVMKSPDEEGSGRKGQGEKGQKDQARNEQEHENRRKK
ncbi:MAG: hypothetical protein R6U32_01575 [Candidatus Woesearchaeota archaeon]